jgi:hypothetical protein
MTTEQEPTIHDLPTYQTTITLDKRRANQLRHLAQGAGKSIAEYLEDLVGKEWRNAYDGMLMSGVDYVGIASDGIVHTLGITIEPLDTRGMILTTKETATELGYMLIRANSRGGASSRSLECNCGQVVTVSRRGNGIIVEIANTIEGGAVDKHKVGLTASLARDYGHDIVTEAHRRFDFAVASLRQ